MMALTLPAMVLTQEHRHDSPEAMKALFAALNLREGSVVADIGAGQGNYSVAMAKAVGSSGRVIAVDIAAGPLAKLRDRAQKEGLTNIEAVQGDVDNPQIGTASVDGVLIVNAYHEMTAYPKMLAHIRAALRPSGRLVIADFTSYRRSLPREQQTSNHEIAPELVLAELRAAGFRIVSLEDPFVIGAGEDTNHIEWLVVATPAAPTPAKPTAAVSNVIADLSSPQLRITLDEFLKLYRDDRVIVLDVRDAATFGKGRIPKARLAPIDALRDQVAELVTATNQVVTFCDCPGEEAAVRAADYLRRRGVPNVKALAGSLEQWRSAGERIER